MGSYYWACYECGASNSIRVQRCRACGYVRPESLTPPAGADAATTEPEPQRSSVDAVVPAEPQDLLSRLTRWADANPRMLYVIAGVLIVPLVLMLLGLNASSALGLWFAALAVGIGVWVYWYSGRSFEKDFQRLTEEWQKATATPAAPLAAASTTVAPRARPPAPSATTERHDTTTELRCPDCAEDVGADAASCPYCEHRFDADRLAYCETCDRRVESVAGGLCPTCGQRTSELTQAPPEPAVPPPIPAPAPPTPARRAAVTSQAPVAKGAYWGARLMVVAGVIVAIGVFLPWITAYATYEGSVSANGFDLYGTNGELLVGLGVLIVVLGLLASFFREYSALMRIGVVVAAIAVGIALVDDYEIVQDIVSEITRRGYQAYLQGQGTASASFGLGIPVIGLGVLIAVVGALLGPPRR